MSNNQAICPIHADFYAHCDCEPIVHVRNGNLPNQRDVKTYLKDNGAEEIGKVFVLRDGHYAGDWAILVSGKLYINPPHVFGVVSKKVKNDI